MKIFVSALVSDRVEKATGILTLPLRPYSKLDAPVSTHADMLVLVLGKRIFCYNDYYFENKAIFDVAENMGYEIVKISKACQKKYPNDVGLNVLVMGNKIFANLKCIADEILTYEREEGFSFVNVKQGYSACSTLVLDENNAITADKGMYDAIVASGKNATLIGSDGIKLNGYNCGFIGGASFVIDNNVYFFGDITTHPDYDIIHEKIKDLKMNEICILSGDVFDFGGAKLV